MSDPFDIEGSEAVAQKRAQTRAAKQLEADNDFRAVVANAAGRRVVFDLLSDAGVYRSSFAGEQSHLTAFNEGRRDTGLRLMDRFERVAPAEFAKMLQEKNA